MNSEEHLKKALDTLAELCDPANVPDGEERYSYVEDRSNRRHAAEEIIGHYRDEHFTRAVKDLTITLNVNGAIPVRPMTRFEMGGTS